MKGTRIIRGDWNVEGNTLFFRTPSGEHIIPSAEDIYEMVFEGRGGRFDPSLSARASELGLAFSRYPASLEIRLAREEKDGIKRLTAALVATTEGSETEIHDAFDRGADHVVIGKSWYPFAAGAYGQVVSIIKSAGVSSLRSISLKQYLEIRKQGIDTQIVKDLTKGAAQNHELHRRDIGRPIYLNGDLYPYQLEGWQWLRFLQDQDLGGILADEMGLGKTIQIIALLASLANERGNGPNLIVATGTLLENWRRELARFAPGLKVTIHHGSSRTGFPQKLKLEDVVVTSYDTVVRDIAMLKEINWNILVLDEAQAIRNSETKRSTVVRRLPRRVAFAVTGTPLENALTDLWSISDFVIPGLLGRKSDFEKRFSNDPAGARAVEPLVTPILLRRRVSEVAKDLPPKIDIPQALLLDEATAKEYEEIRERTLRDYGRSGGLVALMKLRMYCSHPALMVDRHFDDLAQSSAKYSRLLEILEEIVEREEKVLIFTSFNEMADLLVNDIPRRMPVFCAYIDGRVPVPERQGIVDAFSKTSKSGVLVLNPRAAGIGLNIASANHVIHYNLEWNPAVEDQASARAYRRGQTRPVTVHRLFYAETVEEVINDRLDHKRDVASRAVVGTSGLEDEADILKALQMSPIRARTNGKRSKRNRKGS